MTKSKPRTILSLATSATLASSIAAASPAKPALPIHWTDARGITAVMLDRTPYLVTANEAPTPISYAEYGRFLGETQPLVGPDGRPGCGNIATKGPSGCEEAQQAALAARVKAAQADKKVAQHEDAVSARVAGYVAYAERILAAAKGK